MQIKYLPPSPSRPPSFPGKVAALITTAALAVVALMFSAVLLTIVLIVVVFGGTYLWWKTRELRKQMRNFPPPTQTATMQDDAFAGEMFEGEVIEGEAIRVNESSDRIKR